MARLEEQIGEIHGEVCENQAKKKKDSSDTSSKTEERLRKINATLADEMDGSPKVHEEVIEKAIREHAGSSDPTVRRYKKLLQQDRLLFAHPVNESLFFRDSEEYVLAVNAMAKGGKVDGQSYDEILGRYGEEWWREQLPDENEPQGFQ